MNVALKRPTAAPIALPEGCCDLFPDFSQLRYNHKAEGGAFDVLVESCGVGVQRKSITFKPEGWAKCVASPHFEESYRLSMAKLLLELKLDRYT